MNKADIGEMLPKQHALEKRSNRMYLLKVLSSLRFLARQGLPLRGDGDERDSNFYQLLLLRGEDDSTIQPMLERPQLKYTSPEMQNEFVSIMANIVLHTITARF